MYGTVTKRRKKLETQPCVRSVRMTVLASATRVAMNEAENDRTEVVSLDDLKAQIDAIY